jgi:hydrogenase maturation protease
VNGRILIACVGNIFLGDDAFGVEVAQRLSGISLPNNVSVTDFGIRSFDLAYALMEPWDLAILVDAVPQGGEPGTVYVIEPDISATADEEAQDAAMEATFDAHTMNPTNVLQLVSALGGHCPQMLVVGCEPANVEPRDDGQFALSDAVRAAVDEAINAIKEILAGCSHATAA